MTGGKSMRRAWSPSDLERTITNVENRERASISSRTVQAEEKDEEKDNKKRIDELFG